MPGAEWGGQRHRESGGGELERQTDGETESSKLGGRVGGGLVRQRQTEKLTESSKLGGGGGGGGGG